MMYVVVGVVVSGQERVTQFDGQVMKERGQISLHQVNVRQGQGTQRMAADDNLVGTMYLELYR
eukprot:scaffold6342_cov206-Alexandrium_tamarense.AAC.43